MWLLNSLVEDRDIVWEDELVGERDEEGGEWILKNFWIGESLKEYLGDSIDLTGDYLESELLI